MELHSFPLEYGLDLVAHFKQTNMAEVTGYMYAYQNSTLHTLYYNFICQLHPNEAENKVTIYDFWD